MNRALILRLSFGVFLLISLPSYAQTIDLPGAGAQTYFCDSLPCSFTGYNGMYVEVDGQVSQNVYIAILDATVRIDRVPLGGLKMQAVALGDGTFEVIGEVRRIDGNSVHLPPFIIPFKLFLKSLQPGTIPYLSFDDIAFLSVLLTTQDFKLSGLDNNPEASSDSTLVCGENHTKDGNLNCNGPLRGFGIFFPIQNGPDVQKCCNAHDICFLVGGSRKGEDECNDALRKCIEKHIPFYSKIWTSIVMADMWWGDNDGYLENDDANCRCTFDTDRYDLSLWLNKDYNQVYVGHAECCVGSDKCEDNSCTWKFLKDGQEKWKFNGKCISTCNNGKVERARGEECDPPGELCWYLDPNTHAPARGECTDECQCDEPLPLCGNGRFDPGEECDPPGRPSCLTPPPRGSRGNALITICKDDCTCPKSDEITYPVNMNIPDDSTNGSQQ